MKMPTLLRYALVSAGSALVGMIGGYFFAKHRLEKAYDAQLAEALEEECAALRKKHAELIGYKEDEDIRTLTLTKEEVDRLKDMMEQYGSDHVNLEVSPAGFERADLKEKAADDAEEDPTSTTSWLSSLQPAPDVKELMKQYGSEHIQTGEVSGEDGHLRDGTELGPDDDPNAEWENEAQQMEIYRRDHYNDPPIQVSEEEYPNLHPYFNPVDYEYYVEDGVLLDDGLEPIDDVDLHAGDILDGLHHFLSVMPEENRPSHIYIANGRLGLAIDILVRYERYYDDER